MGTAPEPRPGLASGHIPGSLSLPFSELVDPNDVTTFRPVKEMRQKFIEVCMEYLLCTVLRYIYYQIKEGAGSVYATCACDICLV